MKTTKQLSALPALAIVACLLFSCKKEQAAEPEKNSYTYQEGGNRQVQDIGNVVFDNGGTAARFLFYNNANHNDGIEINLKKNTTFTAVPEGSFTNTSAGTIFNDAILYYNDGDESYAVDGIARKISITKNGAHYTITFEFTSGMGLVQGSYTGPVTQ